MSAANFPQFVDTVQRALQNAQLPAQIEKGEYSDGNNYFINFSTFSIDLVTKVNALFENLALDDQKDWHARIGPVDNDWVLTFLQSRELPILKDKGFSGITLYRHLNTELKYPLHYDSETGRFTVLKSSELTQDHFSMVVSDIGLSYGFEGYIPEWVGRTKENNVQFSFKAVAIKGDNVR